LDSIQNYKQFKPITVQLAPIEICDSDCPFCSVARRPLKSYIPFKKIKQILVDFKSLGAKSVEITGGGNPMLYKDPGTKENINDIVRFASALGLDVGIITNSHSFQRLEESVFGMINWIRVSLIKLDENKTPEDYDFNGFPENKLGFSYIIYTGTGDSPDPCSRTKKKYQGTTVESIKKMAQLVQLHPSVKFVRIAGNCLIKGDNTRIRKKYKDIIDAIDTNKKFFIKDIGDDDGPFCGGCYVGLIRPYVAPHPHGGNYQVYICTSHVLNSRSYELDYSLGSVDDIIKIWDNANKHYIKHNFPYAIKNNKGKDWNKSCKFCYYKFNNKLLHTVATEMPDKNFP